MCGFFGVIDLPFDECCLRSIQHRGPDASGTSGFTVCGHTVVLGHQRLSIVDLSSAGAQPMQTPEGRHIIAFNGEIYNHCDLRQSLPAVAWRGHSDTETLLHAVASRGIEVARELNGIFAFSFLDICAGRLYLVRDPFGVKPLYFGRVSTGLAFSSELKPIQTLSRAEIDPAALATVLRLRYLPSPGTMLRGIERVRPGHILEVDLTRSEISIRQYPFAPPPPARSYMTAAEAEQMYAHHIQVAVKRQLMADVEIGVLLSGGVDSAVIAQLAQRQSRQRVKAFTVGFSEACEANEIEAAAETARLLGLEHYYVRVSQDDFLNTVERAISIVEEPIATTSIVPMCYLASLAARHVKVVLSGQGADEPLGGYMRYRAALLHDLLPATFWRAVDPLARLTVSEHCSFGRALGIASSPDDSLRYVRAHSVFTTDEVRDLLGESNGFALSSVCSIGTLLATPYRRSCAERMMSLDLRSELPDDLLLYTDKITMRNSLECRVPMLDLDLVRFIESLPEGYKLSLRAGKRIHRHYACRVLPPSIANRRKKGFPSPTSSWFRDDTRILETLTSSNSQFASWFDRTAVRRVCASRGRSFDKQLFLLLCIYFWMEEFLSPQE